MDVTDTFIPNSSFEQYTACPEIISVPGAMWIDSAVGWHSPTLATPDYYNVCGGPSVGVPFNMAAYYQPAYDGNAYCGFIVRSLVYDSVRTSLWFEYIQCELIQPLNKDQSYTFSMRVNRANDWNLAFKDIGALFSETPLSEYSAQHGAISIQPQIISHTFLTDTMNWTEITGQFVANGNEKYLTIGWFGDTTSVDSVFIHPPEIDSTTGEIIYMPDVYYFVDYLSFAVDTSKLAQSENIPNVFTPNGDGINDFIDFSEFSGAIVTIVNRWGNTILIMNNQSNYQWHGKNYNDKDVPDGVYYFIIEGSNFEQSGSITLIK